MTSPALTFLSRASKSLFGDARFQGEFGFWCIRVSEVLKLAYDKTFGKDVEVLQLLQICLAAKGKGKGKGLAVDGWKEFDPQNAQSSVQALRTPKPTNFKIVLL
eukprot:1182769-Amphidinium_carterae.1